MPPLEAETKINNSQLNHSINRFKATTNPRRLLGIGFEFLFLLMIVLAGTGCSDSCDDVACFNGGICVDGDCVCPEGWTGSDCSTPTSNSTSCESVEFNGYTYEVVAIGTQCWFAENLRSENYRNGDAIPGSLSDAVWTSTTTGAQTVYGKGSSVVQDGSDDEVANLANYGRLYNWYAVDDARGLCPTGWHVPTDAEWTTLTDFLGGSGIAMKSSPSDSPSWDGSNSSGFSALPGGYRYDYYGYFGNEGISGFWWSSSPAGSNGAWYRNLYSGSDNVTRYASSLRTGSSVRCVRD